VSALLVVAALVGWVRSRYVNDQLVRAQVVPDAQPGNVYMHMTAFLHGDGDVCVVALAWSDPDRGPRPPLGPRWDFSRGSIASVRQMMAGHTTGVGRYGWCNWDMKDLGMRAKLKGFMLPYWLLVAASATPWACWAIGFKRRRAARRIAVGCCASCGYELRASPERCPDCGAAAIPFGARAE
jgi:hypothetical protein